MELSIYATQPGRAMKPVLVAIGCWALGITVVIANAYSTQALAIDWLTVTFAVAITTLFVADHLTTRSTQMSTELTPENVELALKAISKIPSAKRRATIEAIDELASRPKQPYAPPRGSAPTLSGPPPVPGARVMTGRAPAAPPQPQPPLGGAGWMPEQQPAGGPAYNLNQPLPDVPPPQHVSDLPDNWIVPPSHVTFVRGEIPQPDPEDDMPRRDHLARVFGGQ